jgi:hypothetical protein
LEEKINVMEGDIVVLQQDRDDAENTIYALRDES